MFPDWLPNIHPLLIHFPIALVILGNSLIIISVLLKNRAWQGFGLVILVPATLGLVAAFISGRLALATVDIPAPANPVLNRHADAALVTLVVSVALLITLLLVWKYSRFRKPWISVVLLLLSLSGMILLAVTADLGGRLVFRYGVGVSREQPPARENAGSREFHSEPDGSWSWRPDSQAAEVLKNRFAWWAGSPDEVRISVDPQVAKPEAVTLHLSGDTVFIVSGESLGNVQVEVTLDLSAFQGEVRVVHHAADAQNYDFLAVKDRTVALGRTIKGVDSIWESGSLDFQGPMIIKAVGSGGHFRAYIDGKLVVHGHARDLKPGPTGLMLKGTGKIHLGAISVISLNK